MCIGCRVIVEVIVGDVIGQVGVVEVDSQVFVYVVVY